MQEAPVDQKTANVWLVLFAAVALGLQAMSTRFQYQQLQLARPLG